MRAPSQTRYSAKGEAGVVRIRTNRLGRHPSKCRAEKANAELLRRVATATAAELARLAAGTQQRAPLNGASARRPDVFTLGARALSTCIPRAG